MIYPLTLDIPISVRCVKPLHDHLLHQRYKSIGMGAGQVLLGKVGEDYGDQKC